MVVGQGAHRTHNERNGHGRLQSLAADVAQDDQCRPSFKGNDLKEVTAHLLRRPIGAGQGEAWNHRQRIGHKNLLQFAGILKLLLQGGLAAAILNGIADDRVDDGEKQKRAEKGDDVDRVAYHGKHGRNHLVGQGPMRIARALRSNVLHKVNHRVAECDCGNRPAGRVEPFAMNKSVGHQHRRDCLERDDPGRQNCIDDLGLDFTEKPRVKQNQEPVECAGGDAEQGGFPRQRRKLSIILQIKEPE